MLRYLALGALAYVGLTYFRNRSTGARYLTGVRIVIRGVAPVGISELQVTFEIHNPNTRDAVVKSVVGDVYVNNNKMARVQTYNQVTVRGNSATTYPVLVKLNPVRAVKSIIDLVKGVAGSTFRFIGTANIDDISQPVNASYTI